MVYYSLFCRYSFGDCRYPSSESAALIEEITHQQIKELVRDYQKVWIDNNGGYLCVYILVWESCGTVPKVHFSVVARSGHPQGFV